MINHPKIVDARGSDVQQLSRKVLEALAVASIEPTPENYELWYHHLSGKFPELSVKIGQLQQQGITFTPEKVDQLRQQYLLAHKAQDETAAEVGETINKLTSLINNFSQQAESYNTRLGKQADHLTTTIQGNPQLEAMLGEVVGQLKDIQKSGLTFGSQLKASQQEIVVLKQSLQKATTEARHDPLTNLLNRRAFDEQMDECIHKAEAEHQDLCLLMLDIDHFKKFNDTWGHQIGDEVIKVVAASLRKTVRGEDVVARFGGEEFAVLLQNTPTNGAHIVAENIRKKIMENRLRRKNTSEEIGRVTVSIGITRYRAGDKAENVSHFIKRADDALYAAKQNGRNRVALEL